MTDIEEFAAKVYSAPPPPRFAPPPRAAAPVAPAAAPAAPVAVPAAPPQRPAGPVLEGLDPELANRLNQAREAYRQRFNKDLPITSGVRTREDQQRLYDRWKAGDKSIFMPLNPADYPKQTTFHTDAVDISTSVPEPFLREFGIHRPLGSKDPVHAVLMPSSQPPAAAPAAPAAPTAAVAPAAPAVPMQSPSQTVSQAAVPMQSPSRTVTQAAAARPAAAPVAAPAAAPAAPAINPSDLMSSQAVDAFAAQAYGQPPKKGAVASKVTSFLRGSAALADTLLGVVPGVAGMATYAGARATGQTPEQAAQTQARVTGALERPVGRAFGVTETPEYKGEASQRLTEYIGQNISKGADWISKQTGMPKAEVEYYINLFGTAAPFSQTVRREAGLAGQAVKQAGGKVVEAAAQVTPAPVRTAVRATTEAVFPGTTRAPARPPGQPGAAAVVTEPPGAELRRNAPTLEQQYQADRQAAAQGQAAVEPQPGFGTARPTTPDAPFTEIKYAETNLPLAEQHARAQTVRRVLGEDYQADLAAIEGRGKERATNYAVSNTDTPQGNFLKDRFLDEQRRLAKYADQRIRDTGGTIGLDESTVYKRGNTILKPLQDLQTYFDDATRKIYADRDAIAKDVPVTVDKVAETLNDRTLSMVADKAERLAKTSKVKLQQLGMMDESGNLLPTDAYRAELFRQWLNKNWSKDANELHKALKAAVDEDVIAKIDQTSPLYRDARALVELRKNTLDNPNGISKILDAEGPNAINRKVDIEKIAQNVIDMPVDQFTHVIDTLRNVPPQLKPQADKALSEIKAQFANHIASKKSPSQITEYMNKNREVMNRVFTPDEINNFRDYHNAAHILATDTGYKGSAVQTINVEKRLARKVGEQVVSKGAALGAETATGGISSGAAALATNAALEQRFAARQARVQAAAEKKAFEQMQTRFVPIGDLLPQNQPGAAGTPIRNVGRQGGARGQNIVNEPLQQRIEPTFDFTLPPGATDLEALSKSQFKRKK